MSASTTPQWHDDLLDAARHVIRPEWCCVVTLKADGSCSADPTRVYKRRQDAFARATRLMNDAELIYEGLTPNYYVVQATWENLILFAGPGYVMHTADVEPWGAAYRPWDKLGPHRDCGNCGGELLGARDDYRCKDCGMTWYVTESGSREPRGKS